MPATLSLGKIQPLFIKNIFILTFLFLFLQFPLRFCDILKDRSMIICESKGNPDNIKEMLPFIESVIWSSKHLNLQCMQEFSGLMVAFFGSQPGSTFCCDESKVDPELKRCLLNIMPSNADINDYFFKLV